MKHMNEIGIRALKQNASAVVAAAAAGGIFAITDRGRPVAMLSPIESSPLASLITSGRARPARHDITALTEPALGATLSVELSAMRDAERY
jgi:prevent-host-death family protein